MEEKSFLGTEMEPVVIPTSDEKTIALLSHVLTVVAPLLAPLIIYIIKKNDSEFIAAHARESLNFQITAIIVCIILAITVVGILLLWAVGILWVIWVVVATIRASEGKLYKYPVNFRLIK